MKSSLLPQIEVLRSLRDKLLPWVRGGQAKLVLTQPPIFAPEGVEITPRRAKLLEVVGQRHNGRFLGRWPEVDLVATRTLYMGIILSGEADLRIGVTTRMAAQNPDLKKSCGYYVMSLPERSFFLIPPGVPFSDGALPHWERKGEAVPSQILWMHILAEGGLIHSCSTRGASHTVTPAVFVRDARFAVLTELLTEALPSCTYEMGQSLLLALLLRLERGLSTGKDLPVEESEGFVGAEIRPGNIENNNGEGIVQSACRYIQAHLAETLTLERIAAHVYVSARQLNRLFQLELNTSVMKFVTDQRMTAAKTLLQGTNLPINEISACLGYVHAGYFSNVFSAATGMTPKQFRLQSASAKPPKAAVKRANRRDAIYRV